MPLITTTFSLYTPESIEAGDAEDNGWIDEEGHDCTPDEYDAEEGKTPVELAVEFITDKGPVEASSYPTVSPGHTWYTQTEGSRDRDYFEKGEETILSFHLKGFTPEQETAIYARLTNR